MLSIARPSHPMDLRQFLESLIDPPILPAEPTQQMLKAVSESTSLNRRQIDRLAAVVEKRIGEVEQDNQLLATILAAVLSHLGEVDPSGKDKVLAEIRRSLSEGNPSKTLTSLREKLGRPVPIRTPISRYMTPPKRLPNPVPRKAPPKRHELPPPGKT